MLPNDPPRAAYIHVPFCRHRCGYCSFTLIAGRDDLIGDYLRAIELELSALDQVYELDTLYFGGGTPTHLSNDQLERLFAAVKTRFRFQNNAEITIEANPLDLLPSREAPGKRQLLKDFGVTRLSLGVQSFRDDKLAFLERDHKASQIHAAFDEARGIAPDVSLDLIFATPGETLDQWRSDLQQAIELAPDHISTYGLTFEAGSAIFGKQQRGAIVAVEESLEASMYELAIDELSSAGYEQYEVSNFARAGHRSRHNQTYWSGRSYLASGPGAARYVHGRREMNHRSTTTYIARMLSGQSPVAESESLAGDERAIERLVFGLRMLNGVEHTSFAADTGFRIDELVGDEVQNLVSLGLLEIHDDHLRLTRRGLMVSDAVFSRLLRARSDRRPRLS